ncbi:MAG: hypothetical protein JWL62_3847 [Hyphomicrobiales bacterium]|nr:hypothetical protein [Hyphomicrobiales bacterium]
MMIEQAMAQGRDWHAAMRRWNERRVIAGGMHAEYR